MSTAPKLLKSPDQGSGWLEAEQGQRTGSAEGDQGAFSHPAALERMSLSWKSHLRHYSRTLRTAPKSQGTLWHPVLNLHAMAHFSLQQCFLRTQGPILTEAQSCPSAGLPLFRTGAARQPKGRPATRLPLPCGPGKPSLQPPPKPHEGYPPNSLQCMEEKRLVGISTELLCWGK